MFLYLWALSNVYRGCDYSFHDTDVPQEGQKQLTALANLWKRVLSLPAVAVRPKHISSFSRNKSVHFECHSSFAHLIPVFWTARY